MRSTRRPVPTGTVDLVTTTVRFAPVAGQRRGDLGGGGEDIGEIGVAVAAPRRRADGDEHRLGAVERRLEVGGEGEPAGRLVDRDELVEARLVDRHLAALQPRDLVGVLVDAGDRHAEFGEAGPRDEPDIARADHRYTHQPTPFRAGSDRSPERAAAGLFHHLSLHCGMVGQPKEHRRAHRRCVGVVPTGF
jgi:hypothetical protein